MRKFILYPLVLVAGLFAGLLLSDGSVWTLIAGPPDMGRADFARVERPENEFVACSEGADCARPDLRFGSMTTTPEAALAMVAEKLGPDAERVDDASDPLHRRYVVRTRWLKFPDTVSIDAAPLDGRTALRISSRSQIGQSDFGVNEARVRDLVAAL